jgi:APA family basic amino acid/polyamine antiporter
MCIVVGSTFGIGIFIGPPEAAKQTDSVLVLLLLWIGTGLLSLGGAGSCAELGAMMPRAGGDYVFQRRAFGPSFAFASGWLLVAAVFGGSLASMSVAVCEFQFSYLLSWISGRSIALGTPLINVSGWSITGAQVGAIAVVLAYTSLNVWGTRQSARVQTIFTLVPFAAAALLAIVTLSLTPSRDAATTASETLSPAPGLSVKGLALAYLPVFFAYSGWNVIIYVGGEVARPERIIPRALIGGLLAITALYTLLVVAFVHALGISGLREVGEAGTASAAAFFGERGRVIMTMLMTVALLTCINGATLTGARIAFAMARDHAFWSKAGTLSRRNTPAVALWIQALIACGLIFTGTFSELLAICAIAMILGGALNVLALFALRWREPHAERPCRAPLYPVLPAMYLLLNVIAISVLLYRAINPAEGDRRPWYPLLGLGLFVAVWCGHALWRIVFAKNNAGPGGH